MENLLSLLILTTMGAQFGIALSASVIVDPILKAATKTTAIEVFKPFFNKTHKTVLTMSILVSLMALVLSVLTQNWWWFGISAAMHLNGPYTIFFMMPLNRRLMADDVDPHSTQTAQDIQKWGSLHLVRTILNGSIFLGFIILEIYS
ncbi:MAG: DUF1772 domain-containing protein [Bacteroidia bacterium]